MTALARSLRLPEDERLYFIVLSFRVLAARPSWAMLRCIGAESDKSDRVRVWALATEPVL
ncbi:hypothetical protein GCM10023068_43300 [Leifsonia shinshuensis]